MLIRIDPQSAEPIFEQIAFAVKNAAARGDARAGDKLPSVRVLARELAINPNTVVRAYELLERDGVVVRRQGAGCFLTGHGSELGSPQRKKQLKELLHRATTEAFHLGFTSEDVRNELEQCLQRVQFDRGAARTAAKRSDKS